MDMFSTEYANALLERHPILGARERGRGDDRPPLEPQAFFDLAHALMIWRRVAVFPTYNDPPVSPSLLLGVASRCFPNAAQEISLANDLSSLKTAIESIRTLSDHGGFDLLCERLNELEERGDFLSHRCESRGKYEVELPIAGFDGDEDWTAEVAENGVALLAKFGGVPVTVGTCDKPDGLLAMARIGGWDVDVRLHLMDAANWKGRVYFVASMTR